jgi:hypothetical protein
MQTYITVRSFRRRRNKKNEEYGWSVADFTISENLFGADHVRSAYHLSSEDAKQKIIDRVKVKFSKAELNEIEKIIR